jgi:hypothetical protein
MWADAGWTGYMLFQNGVIVWTGLNIHGNLTYARSTQEDFLGYADSVAGYTVQQYSVFPSFYSYYQTIAPQWGARILDSIWGGWLLPREGHLGAENIEAHTSAILDIAATTDLFAYMLIGGGAVTTKSACESAVNPAWRKALVAGVITIDVPLEASFTTKTAIEQEVSEKTQLLRNLAPDSGAYLNEADRLEPNWQHALFYL